MPINQSSDLEAKLTEKQLRQSFYNCIEAAAEGDDELFNQYGVIAVNPQKCPNVKRSEGQAFVDWLLSDEGQSAIGRYRMNGQQLFFPNAR